MEIKVDYIQIIKSEKQFITRPQRNGTITPSMNEILLGYSTYYKVKICKYPQQDYNNALNILNKYDIIPQDICKRYQGVLQKEDILISQLMSISNWAIISVQCDQYFMIYRIYSFEASK